MSMKIKTRDQSPNPKIDDSNLNTENIITLNYLKRLPRETKTEFDDRIKTQLTKDIESLNKHRILSNTFIKIIFVPQKKLWMF